MSEERVASVERALAILDAFDSESSALSLADLVQRTGMYRSTLLRLSASLMRHGYLNRDESGMFRLGPSLFRLGSLYQRSFALEDYVRPVLRKLVEETGETAAFYVKEGNVRVCLYRHHSSRLFRHHVEEGATLPLDKGASARVLMAFDGAEGALYAQVREEGWYVSYGERDAETTAVSVPVFGVNNRLMGALGVTGSKGRMTPQVVEKVRTVMLTNAAQLSSTLGARLVGRS